MPLVIAIVSGWGLAAKAQDVPMTPEYLKGTLDVIWITIAAVLVIFMNAGFGMLETGFCRRKNAVSVLSKNLIVFVLATLAFWAVGFSLMFGQGTPFIGGGGWFLTGDGAAYGLEPFPAGLPVTVFFLFQVAFASTAATIVSGAVAERIHFTAFLIFSLLLSGIAYPITGHWVWSGNGWLGALGFSDFAGSTVVHSVGGWAALVGAIALGPRTGKYRDGQPTAMPGHNISLSMLGCMILWIGWFGFNPGSELAASEAVPYIALTTNLAAVAGGLAAFMASLTLLGTPDLSMIINGVLAGLVGITAGCAEVSHFGALVIGGVAGVLVIGAILLFDRLQVDDPVGAISVHLVCGIWGTLAVGLLSTETGLFYGAGINQLLLQLLGIASIGLFSVVVTALFWTALKLTIGIRVDAKAEELGLSVAEHGMEAYSGFPR